MKTTLTRNLKIIKANIKVLTISPSTRLIYPITSFIIALSISYLIFTPFLPILRQRKDNLAIFLLYLGLLLGTVFITSLTSNFLDAALLISIKQELNGQKSHFISNLKQVFQHTIPLTYYAIYLTNLQLRNFILIHLLGLFQVLIILPWIIKKISKFRAEIKHNIQAILVFPIILFEKTSYSQALLRSKEIITNQWGIPVSITYSFNLILLLFALIIFILILTLRHIDQREIASYLLITLIVTIKTLDNLFTRIYGLAAYCYSIEGRNDIYHNPTIAPSAFTIIKEK